MLKSELEFFKAVLEGQIAIYYSN